jgi:hypothetical protein
MMYGELASRKVFRGSCQLPSMLRLESVSLDRSGCVVGPYGGRRTLPSGLRLHARSSGETHPVGR